MAGSTTIKFSRKAREHLDRILLYQLKQGGQHKAQAIYLLINQALQQARLLPGAKPLFMPERKFRHQYRFITIKRTYQILYFFDQVSDELIVPAIMPGRYDKGVTIQLLEQE